jgi:uncharacterized protein
MRVIISAAILGLCAIFAFFVIGKAYKYRSTSAETITVTGLAEKDFNSDLIVWNGSYSRKSMDLKNTYAALKGDESAIRSYLKSKGINDNEIVFSAIDITREFDKKVDKDDRSLGDVFTGYNLKQTVTIQSPDVDKVEKISREATELIQNGIEFTSSSPLYYNTKLAEVKMELLGKASADAKARAETIAKNAGNSLGKLKKATMGVFQITGKNSNEDFSYGGAFNTSNRLKTGSITIRMEFAVD